MNKVFRLVWKGLILCSLLLSACQPVLTSASDQSTPRPATAAAEKSVQIYKDPSAPVEQRVADLLGRMTLEEKIGQMTQIEKNSIQAEDVTRLFIGSVLSGGGGYPMPNDVTAWYEMVSAYQQAALKTRLGIPLIYGVDAVHGHNTLQGATIYPHQIGLGATRDADLVKRIGRATAEEMIATGIYWNFAPVVAVPQDIRWGRTYEGYAENTELVSQLGVAYIQGIQGEKISDPTSALATAKHYMGDGATQFGSSTTINYLLDQGDMQVDEATLRTVFLPPYKAAVDAGVLSVMASFSSWNGTKMHAHKTLLTDVLKGELGFQGLVVSDWAGIDQISPDYSASVVAAINAGVDMNMVPYDANKFINVMKAAVEKGDISQERIDDAVSRILRVKFKLGLFEHPAGVKDLQSKVGAAEHRQLAREAVAKSLVLLKNDHQALPLAKNTSTVFVAGQGADDIGMQCGGWTIEWQGRSGDITPGTSILKAIQQTVSTDTAVKFDPYGNFKKAVDAAGKPIMADVGVVVVGEKPYAEGVGDTRDLTLSADDVDLIKKVRARSEKLVVIILSGRPLIITEALPLADAWVAAWLPGTEGQGVADVLFGDKAFTGKLSYTWPRSMDQVPIHSDKAAGGAGDPLFPYGYGLTE